MMLLRPPRMPCEIVGARTVMPRTTPLYSRTLRPCTSNVVETILDCAMATDSPWFWVDASGPDWETERLAGEFPPQRREGIVVRVHHPLLERDDGVVRNRDRLGTDLGATLRDVAIADPARFAEIGPAVRLVERVHLVHRGAHEKRGAHELGVLAVRAQHVTYVLAEEALDALAEFLGPLDLVLIHAPGTIRRVGGAGLERGDPLVDFVVPGDVGHEVLDHGHADESLPRDQGPRDRRLLELRSQQADPRVPAPRPRRAGWYLADVSVRGRAAPGIPQVHRVLPVPGRMSRAARARQARRVHGPRVSRARRGVRNAPARRGGPPVVSPRGGRDRELQHHEELYRGLSRVDADHRQLHHPAQ